MQELTVIFIWVIVCRWNGMLVLKLLYLGIACFNAVFCKHLGKTHSLHLIGEGICISH
jgi:hypothetical protein